VAAARRWRGAKSAVVGGPSTDGGYYLLGLSDRIAGCSKISIVSTERVAAQTLARARELKPFPCTQLPSGYERRRCRLAAVCWFASCSRKSLSRLGKQADAGHLTRRELARLLGSADLRARLGALMPSSLVHDRQRLSSGPGADGRTWRLAAMGAVLAGLTAASPTLNLA